MINAAPISLEGKNCLVTGANGGIGASTAEHFAMLGATVYATDIGDRFSGNCKASYKRFNLISDDGLSDASAWIKDVRPDILFNNAAVFDMGSILQADLDQFDRLFRLNVRAMFAVMQSAAQSMVANGQPGSIINLSSQAGHRGEALVAHYCATKAAVISYTQSAALALAEYKIRVNAISPGVVDTPMWDSVDALFAKFEDKPLGQKKREVGEAVPLGYMAQPHEIARVAVFLASDQSQYITAQTLGVDGGSVLRM
ncbi:MAG: SDR family oxidoreductase [Pseudomonadota bacterium]